MATYDATTLSTTDGLLTYQTQIKNLLTNRVIQRLGYFKGSTIRTTVIRHPKITIVTLYNISGATYKPQIIDFGDKKYGFVINADTKLIQIREEGELIARYKSVQGELPIVVNDINGAEDGVISTTDRVIYDVESQGTFNDKILLAKKVLRNKLYMSLRGRGQYDPIINITNPDVLSTASDYLTIFYIYNDASTSMQSLYYQKAQAYYSMFLQEYNTILNKLQVENIGDQYKSVAGITSHLLRPY